MPAPKSSKKPTVEMPSKKQLDELIRPYSDEELSTVDLEDKIKNLMDFFGQKAVNHKKELQEEYLSSLTEKKAYPNYDQYQNMPGQHDMKKWMYAVKDVQYKQKAGFPYKEAIKHATSGWPKMEIYDFLNWLRFHEEGSHMKYKFAQVWYENGQPGYFLHVKKDPPVEPEPKSDGETIDNSREEDERNEEKRNIIEKQRSKIIGRLDSAEKLLRSPDGQQFAGVELENLMEAIYSLKKKVQLVNKLSISTRLYEDMIVREANVLRRHGFVKAAAMLYSVAQTPGQAGQGATGTTDAGAMPPATPPADPSGAGNPGAPGGLPATAPGVPDINTPVGQDQNKSQPPAVAIMEGGNAPTGTAQSTPAIVPQEPPQPKGIKEFIQNMNEGNKTDNTEADDDLEVIDELNVEDPEEMLMVTEAQTLPIAPPGPPAAALEDVPMTDSPAPERNPPAFIPTVEDKPKKPKGAVEDEPLEVTEDDIPTPGGDQATSTPSNFDAQVDNAFKNATIADVVAELEDISKDYKTRKQPRRLNKVDMMLDSLGLASMFPSLAEAQNKALESNNYISSRVDDILSKLRGAMASQEKIEAPSPERPEVTGIKNKLQDDQEKELKRKQMRKEQEASELEGGAGKETPEVEMGELGAPAAPAPPAPPAAPARAPVPKPLG
jgi:hypothetical protein